MKARRTSRPTASLDFATRENVAWLTLDLRATRGRISLEVAQALCDAAGAIGLDDAVAVVVVQTRGADFCVGLEGDDWDMQVDCIEAIATLPQPVVAAVHGPARAEGCELALACDLRVGTDR